MRIMVTQDDIDRGMMADYVFCPIALATSRAFPGCCIRVQPGCIQIGPDVYPLTEGVTEFIDTFDDGRQVEPFEFEVSDPI